MNTERNRQIYKTATVLFCVLSFGVSGLMIIEGWSFLDSLYMSVITLSTIGYREVNPLSTAGMVFIMVFIIFGVGSFFYVLMGAAEFVVEGHLRGVLGRNKMKKRIHGLKDHYIICGFGRVGQMVARELKKDGVEFVVIEIDEKGINKCKEVGYLHLEGSASDDEVLKEAGIMHAKGLVSAIDSDAENVYVTLSAKNLRAEIYIVARASCEEAEIKLLKAHADRVLSPYSLGGKRLASLLLRPNVVDFLDVVMHNDVKLVIEEIEIVENSPLAGLAIGHAREARNGGHNILALKKRSSKEIIASPGNELVLEHGDLLITFGQGGNSKT